MGNGSTKGNKVDIKKANSKQDKGSKQQGAQEIKESNLQQKEQNDTKQQQERVQKGNIEQQQSLFIGNNEKLSGQPRRSLSIMKIEEQQQNQNYDKSRIQDSLLVNPSPERDNNQKSNIDSFVLKGINLQPFQMQMQNQKAGASQFKTPIQNNQQSKYVDNQNNKNQKQKNDISLDLSGEMSPEFNCDISAIYSEEEIETQQQQAERIFKKIQQVAGINKLQNMSDKMRFFNWPPSGECKIMSVNFKIIYSHKDQDLKLVKQYDYHTSSTLTWQKNEQYKSYDFVLQDNAIFDAHNASTTHLRNNIISFLVSEKGEFLCIKDEQKFVKNVRKNQTLINTRANITVQNDQTAQRRSRQSIVKNQKIDKSKVITETENQMKQMWAKSITEFLEKSTVNKENINVQGKGDNYENENQQQGQKGQKSINNYNLVHNGYNCTGIQKIEIQSKEKIENFLKQNLSTSEKYFNFCFKNPKRTIKDKLKEWDIVDEKEDFELMPKKFRFPILRKHEVTTGVMEDKNSFMRPHTISTDFCKMIIIDHKRDLFVDVEQELKLLVFLWPERSDNQNEIHFYEELGKFKDTCDDALKSMVLDLARVRALPLSYKPKLKKKYFELY